MSVDSFVAAAAILISITSIGLILTADWRINISFLAIQYIGVFILIASTWPMQMSVTMLVAGWIGGAVLGMALTGTSSEDNDQSTVVEQQSHNAFPQMFLSSGRPFQLLTGILAWLACLFLAPKLESQIPGIRIEQAFGSLILISLGLLKIGFSDHSFQTIVGLLTSLSGFVILYASLESSALVAGLLAAVTMGLALTGAYLLLAPESKELN